MNEPKPTDVVRTGAVAMVLVGTATVLAGGSLVDGAWVGGAMMSLAILFDVLATEYGWYNA